MSTTRLPQPGKDDGVWGTLLNDFLTVEHNTDGSLKLRTDTALTGKADDTTVVHKTGDETIAGNKTFTLPLTIATPTTASHATTKTYVDSGLAAKADNTAVVHLSGDETIAGVKTFSSLPVVSADPSSANQLVRKSYVDGLNASATSATALNVTGARPVVSAQWNNRLTQVQYTFLESKSAHFITSSCSDLRLLYTSGTGNETELTNPVFLKVGVSMDGTTYFPLTFEGRQNGQLDPGGILVSDPIAFDITAGTTIYVSSHQSQAFGVSTTLAAASSIGATTLSLTAMPNISSGYIAVDSGANIESVYVTSITGSGPYTATLSSGTTCAKAHASGVYVGQQLFVNSNGWADLNEGASGYVSATAVDKSYTGVYSALTASTTTIGGSSTVAVGSTSIILNAAILSSTLTIDTGGSQETIAVKNITGTAPPYTYYLAAPTAFSHSVGATVASGVNYGNIVRPTAIVADRVTTSPPCVVGVGTSIMATSAYLLRGNYVTYPMLAFNGHNPFINLAIGGELASTFASLAGSLRRRRMLSMGKWLLVNYPTNDISGGHTLAQVQADITTIINLAKSRGMKIALETVIPRTTSSDGFMTVANQTLPPYESVRLAYNAWVRGGAGGLTDLIIDTDAKIDSGLSVGGAATGKWLAAGTDGPYTSDGTHPSTTGHVLMATAINPALFI